MSAVWSGLVAPAAERLRAARTAHDRLAAIATIAERLGFATGHTARPSAGMSADWHAAVLGAPDGEIFLLDRDGIWRQPIADIAAIVINRSAAMEALQRTLVKRDDIFESSANPSEGPSELTR